MSGVDVSGCEHPEKDCSGCSCCCPTCQIEYEQMWINHVDRLKLCQACGMPEAPTMETLEATKEYHFFLPCLDCRESYIKTLHTAGICPFCHNKYQDGHCAKCD